jgi:hypothetical protein
MFRVTEFGLGKGWNDFLVGGRVVGTFVCHKYISFSGTFTISVVDFKSLANKVERCIYGTVICHCWKRRFYGIYDRESEVKIRELSFVIVENAGYTVFMTENQK